MTKTFKWAALGDLQAPYHDKRAVDLWFKVMKWWKPDAIDIVGDISDFIEYSTFSDGTTDEFFNQLKKLKQDEDESDEDFRKRISPVDFTIQNEKVVREFYERIRGQHPDADIHASLGNHEIRVWKYYDRKAPDFLPEITPNSLWGLDDLGITHAAYDRPPLERFAGIHVHHGLTTTTTGLAVKGDIESYGVSLLRGHDHRGGVVYKSYPIKNETLVGIATGHLCDPKGYGLRYASEVSPWELGFAIIHVDGNNVQPQFIRISPEYTCIVDGRRFQG